VGNRVKSTGILAALVAVGIGAQGQEPPEPQPVFPAETELVTVDAVVLNRRGSPVTGLRASDFSLSEDGVRQEIVSFEAVQRPAPTGPVGLPVAALAPRVSSNRAAVAGSARAFLVVVDDLHMGPTETARARGAVAPLLQSTAEGDRVTLVATSGTSWWHARMPEGREGLLSIVHRLRGRAGTRDDDDALRAALEILVRALASLEGVRGRKSVLFLSGGFAYDPTFAGLFHEAVTEARRVNAAIYFVDARGLVALPPSGSREGFRSAGSPLAGSAGTASLAWDTGGFAVEDRNDLADGARAIARESSSCYLLGYVPPQRGRDGFRAIEVKVAREGVRVRARRGYYATTSRDLEGSRERALRRALDSPFDREGIPLRIAAHVFEEKTPGQARVLITTEVDVQALRLREGGGASVDALEYRLLVAHLETGSTLAGEQHIPVRPRPEARELGLRRWLPITSEAALAPGRHQARVVVAEANDRRVGSVSHEFDVPPLDGLRVSTPVLSDRLREPPGAGPELIARRTFVPAGVLHCLVEVYGATKEPASGRPAVSAALAVRRADGLLLASADATRIEPGTGGALVRTVGVPLEGAPEGSYEMVVTVEDEVGRRVVAVREAFVVDPDGEP
jgi:VWFA-related protein